MGTQCLPLDTSDTDNTLPADQPSSVLAAVASAAAAPAAAVPAAAVPAAVVGAVVPFVPQIGVTGTWDASAVLLLGKNT